NAGGKFKILDEIPAEQREVNDSKTGCVPACHGVADRGGVNRPPSARVLEFQAREYFFFDQWHTHVEFDQVLRGIGQAGVARAVLGLLVGVAGPTADSVGPKPFECQLYTFGFRIEVCEAAAL